MSQLGCDSQSHNVKAPYFICFIRRLRLNSINAADTVLKAVCRSLWVYYSICRHRNYYNNTVSTLVRHIVINYT